MPDFAPRSLSEASAGRLATGWLALDRLLGGGWPPGELTEIVGRGRASLALAAVRQAQSAGQPAAWVDGSASFCPATAGLDLGALTLVRPPPALAERPGRSARRRRGPASAALLAADLLLRSRAFGLLVLDLPEVAPPALAAWFRLARQASRAHSVLLLLGSAERTVAGSAAGLTLRAAWRHPSAASWEPLPPPALEVAVLRRRGGPLGRAVVLPAAS
jgi:hypothetical protein